MPALSSSWGRAAMPTQPRARAVTTETHFGARTQQNFIKAARPAPIQTIASTVTWRGPCSPSSSHSRIGACDQHVDAGVVDAAHPHPGADVPVDAVVERARGQHHRDRAGERGGGDGRAPAVGLGDQSVPTTSATPEADLVRTPQLNGLGGRGSAGGSAIEAAFRAVYAALPGAGHRLARRRARRVEAATRRSSAPTPIFDPRIGQNRCRRSACLKGRCLAPFSTAGSEFRTGW